MKTAEVREVIKRITKENPRLKNDLIDNVLEQYAKQHDKEVIKVGFLAGMLYDPDTEPFPQKAVNEAYDEWIKPEGDDRPMCDECGQPLGNDELNIGTCEDCLCPE